MIKYLQLRTSGDYNSFPLNLSIFYIDLLAIAYYDAPLFV